MEAPETISARIFEHLQNLPSKTISGTDLAQFLRFSFPGFSPFSYRARNLRVFLQQFVPTVVPVGHSGGDLLYGLKPQGQEQLTLVEPPFPGPTIMASEAHSPTMAELRPSSTMNRPLWKAFSSPNSLWKIYANPESGEVRVAFPGRAAFPPPWVHIPPCSPEFLLQIARSFVSELSDKGKRDTLQELISTPRWWDQFYSSTAQLGVLREWQTYRRREIYKRYFESLERLGIPTKSKLSSLATAQQICQGETLPRNEREYTLGENERFRRAVLSAIERMSISELRSLPIPAGYLLDELKRRI